MILNNKSRVVFPFIYDDFIRLKNYKRVNSKNEEKDCFCEKDIDAQELRQGVQGLLKNNHSAKIASTYALKVDARSEFLLPKKEEYPLTLSTQSGEYKFLLKDVFIHFFEAKVGFLVFDVESLEKDISKANDFRYYFCEVKSDKNVISFDEKISKDETKNVSFTLITLIKKIMELVDGATDFDHSTSFHYSENRPLIYSYFYLDKKDEKTDLYNLGLNYKSSYKVNKNIVKIFEPFENSKWLFSDNCVTNVSFETDDDVTNNFFNTSFVNKFTSVYYLLYVSAVNQKFSMIHYMNKLVFNDNLNLPISELKEEIKILRAKQDEFISFKYRNLFQVPSSISQINIYYEYLQTCLQIKKIENNLDSDMNLIISSLNSLISKDDQYKQLLDLRKSSVRDLILVFVSSILAFASLYETIFKLMNIFKVEASKAGNIVIFIVMFLICLVLPSIFNIQKNIKTYKKANKKIKEMQNKL